jgi:hypothetical protein
VDGETVAKIPIENKESAIGQNVPRAATAVDLENTGRKTAKRRKFCGGGPRRGGRTVLCLKRA